MRVTTTICKLSCIAFYLFIFFPNIGFVVWPQYRMMPSSEQNLARNIDPLKKKVGEQEKRGAMKIDITRISRYRVLCALFSLLDDVVLCDCICCYTTGPNIVLVWWYSLSLYAPTCFAGPT